MHVQSVRLQTTYEAQHIELRSTTVIDCKEVKRARLSTLGEGFGTYHAGESPWSLEELKVDLAMPCATQNEINGEAAARLVKNGVVGVGHRPIYLPIWTDKM